MSQTAVGDRELQVAKSFLIGSFPLRLDTSRKVADLLIGIEEYGLGLDYPEYFMAPKCNVTRFTATMGNEQSGALK